MSLNPPARAPAGRPAGHTVGERLRGPTVTDGRPDFNDDGFLVSCNSESESDSAAESIRRRRGGRRLSTRVPIPSLSRHDHDPVVASESWFGPLGPGRAAAA
jgi:hypothetical protein